MWQPCLGLSLDRSNRLLSLELDAGSLGVRQGQTESIKARAIKGQRYLKD